MSGYPDTFRSLKNSAPEGPQGPQGEVGPQGPAGPTGPQGPKGDTGAQGSKGNPGEIGQVGPMGLTGPAGKDSTVPGPTGPDGALGLTGATGPQGPRGEQGVAGTGVNLKGHVATVADLPTGATQGDTYVVDETDHAWSWSETSNSYIDLGKITGPTGETGSQGPAGKDGTNGADGAQGPKGDTGAQGVAGAVGPQGPKGDTGETGPAGSDGTGGGGSSGPAFSLYKRSEQTLTASPATILFTITFDTDASVTGSVFKPTVAGYYSLSWAVGNGDTSVTSTACIVTTLEGSGSTSPYVGSEATNSRFSTGTVLRAFNGTTDEAKVTACQKGSSGFVVGLGSYFTGHFVRPL